MEKSIKTLLLLPIFLSILFLSSKAYAAAPDGFGPWADKVISTSQGLMKNGSPVPAVRSDPTATLGVAENDTVDSHFYSLGFGGKITLGFKNGIKNGVIVVEATNPSYPKEKANVEVSPDKEHWFSAGTVVQDGRVGIPYRAGCVHYVRITDTSNPSDFSDPTADAYDVDGVKGEGEKCKNKAYEDKEEDKEDKKDEKEHEYNDNRNNGSNNNHNDENDNDENED